MNYKSVATLLERGNNNLDFIRLLAASSVIFSHSYALNNPEKHPEPVAWLLNNETAGGLAVYLFFFISGMLVTNSILVKKNIFEFILARTLRILPALAFTTIFIATIIGPVVTSLSLSDYFSHPAWHEYIVNNLIMNTQFLLPGVFENNYYPSSVNGSIWTIRYEVICYFTLMSFFILWLPRKKIVGSLICIAVIITPFISFINHSSIKLPDDHLVITFSCFAVGSLFAINKETIKLNYFMMASLFIIYFPIKFIEPHFARPYLAFSLCVFFFYISSHKTVKKLHMKHDISYGVYLWGFVIQQMIAHYFSLNIYTSQIFSLLAALIMGYFSAKFIEKPAMNLHRKIVKKKWLVEGDKISTHTIK